MKYEEDDKSLLVNVDVNRNRTILLYEEFMIKLYRVVNSRPFD